MRWPQELSTLLHWSTRLLRHLCQPGIDPLLPATIVCLHLPPALQVDKSLPLDAAAPLLCAGITTYSPMKYHGEVACQGW